MLLLCFSKRCEGRLAKEGSLAPHTREKFSVNFRGVIATKASQAKKPTTPYLEIFLKFIFHLFKNNLKYMYFLMSHPIIFTKYFFTCHVIQIN